MRKIIGKQRVKERKGHFEAILVQELASELKMVFVFPFTFLSFIFSPEADLISYHLPFGTKPKSILQVQQSPNILNPLNADTRPGRNNIINIIIIVYTYLISSQSIS